ncbi:polymorphic toxin-type HINT domain-containing protein [Plantactinospora soyae]|uniref:polymorphic toxin-type HINT domain-containing protein n=1 Tax=Plantactinospora soyae TaxID=1544732 RepID=UPI00298F23E8|nr:polymorphic toxin-type HINT domain-containing protein [Plantactinospora soyae]
MSEDRPERTAWGRRRRRRLRSVWRPGVAAGLVGLLALNLAGSGIVAAPASWRDPAARHTAGKAPDQRWGSAAGGSHLTGGSVNRELPRSLRGQYPLRTLDQQPKPGRNEARVADPPVAESGGFDKATSRERPSGRGGNERVYDNADGSQTTEFSPSPLNYQRPDGSWAPIDSTLVPDPEGSGWRNAADSVELRLAEDASAGQLARLTLDGGEVLAFGLAGAATSPGRVDGDTVTYPGVRPGVDLRLTARPGGVKETLVLASAQAPRSYLFPLELHGLSTSLVDGHVVLADPAGRQRAAIPPGYMLDAGTGADGPAMSTGVTYQLVTDNGRPALRMDLDGTWLQDPDRRYPVEVDPTVGPPVGAFTTDSTMYVQGGNSVANTTELLVGQTKNGSAATYLKFGGVTSRLQNHTIYGAALSVVNYDAPSCRARPVSVHPVTGSWTAGSGYAYPGPAVGGALVTKSFAHGFIGTGQSQSACPVAAEMFDLGVNGRKLVQRWVNGQQANHGLSLRAPTNDELARKTFAGTGTANPPSLYVTHTPYNAGYEIPKPTPDPAVLQNRDGKVQITVTNRGAEAWSPGSYYLAYRAYNANTGASVTQQRSANLPGNVARGGRVTLDATIKALPPGAYFLDFTMVRTGGIVFTDHQVPPARIVLQIFDVEPVVQALYPANGYETPTLTPLLWAQAIDTDAPPGLALQYKFELCDQTEAGAPTNCANSGYQTKPSWTVPAGRLVWSKNYSWRAYVKDAGNEVITDYVVLRTSVPQPDVISRIAGAPGAEQGRQFDAQVGNFTTSAVDAAVATVGPELSLVRTYNSLDPRTSSVFGPGWSSRYDVRLTPDDDGSGNVVVRYPDGQEVRFGKNPDGSYAAPAGRLAKLTVTSTEWRLLDRAGTVHHFALDGTLVKITDNAARSLLLRYDNARRLTSVQVSNSQSNTAGRSLRFTWSGDRIGTVSTDPVNGAALTWAYTYTNGLLTKVCAPDAKCTTYEYAAGSHYRTGVLDARPDSYYRLGEAEGTSAASDVAINLGKDAGTYRNVLLNQPGVLEGTTSTAVGFNGTSSQVELPKGLVKKSRDAAVELWFRIGLTQTGGPLLGYQDKALGTAPTSGVPVLYTDTNGFLRGQFATGTTTTIASGAKVNDDKWHHVVLSAMGNIQTLFLDGKEIGKLTGQTIEHSLLTVNQLGAAAVPNPTAWPGWGGAGQRHFAGLIDEAAVYSHPLGPDTVEAHFQYAKPAAQQLTKVILPTGRVASEVEYDTVSDRVKEYTDGDGGTWKVGLPAVYGGDTDLRRSVQVLDPANRPHLYEYDALAGRLLRSGVPLGLETREEDRPGGIPTTSPNPPTEVCSVPDPGDPAFCTIIPDSSGGPIFVRHPLDGMAIRTFSYNNQGQQGKVTNENGHAVEMTYDSRGNLATRKSCRTATECYTAYYSYSTTVTDPFNPLSSLATETRDERSRDAADNTYRTSYTYDQTTGQLTSQLSPDNSRVSHTYTRGTESAVGGGSPPSGLLATSMDARNKLTRQEYYANGDLARVTEPSGLVTEYTYDTLGRKTTEKVISDKYPAGVTVTYTYDAHGRVATVVGPVTTNAVSSTTHQSKTTNGYDDDGNLLTVTLADIAAGGPERVSSTEYDDHNRPIRVVDAEGNETSYGYDRFGNRTSMVDPNGNRYDWAYTARNNVAEVRLRNWRSDPAGSPGTGTGDYLVLHSYSYDHAGRMVSDTDAMGRRLEYQYYRDDRLHRLVLKDFRDPNGSKRDYVIEENTYDGAGSLVRKVEGNGRLTTQHTVDAAGKVSTTVVDPAGLARTTSYRYDLNGNVDRTTRTGRPSNVPWTVVAGSEVVEYSHDEVGNVLEEKVIAGTESRITSYTYDRRGLRLTVTDPRGNVPGATKAAFTTSFQYDELGRQIGSTGPAVPVESGGVSGGVVNPTSAVGYNAFGDQVAVRDPRGQVSKVEYDKLGRAVRTIAPTYTPPGMTVPITPEVRTGYDGLGNVVEQIRRSGTTRMSYDQLSRLTSQDVPTVTNDDRAVTHYTYTRTGQVLSVTDPTGARVESTYDDLDRQVTQTRLERRPVAKTLTSRMVYDDAGNLTSTVSPTGAMTINAHDAVGDVIRTTAPTGEARLFGYDSSGRQVRVSDGLGRTVRVNYDLFGNRASDANLKPDNTVLRTQTYGYDVAGNMISSKDPYDAVTTYRYDAASRLAEQVEPVSATESITTSFGYDAAGNRTRYTDGRRNSTIYTYNTLGLAESVIDPATASHPAAADRTWTVGYDAEGRPAQLSAPGGVSRQRTYDAAGRLTGETGSGGGSATTARTLGYDEVGRPTSVSAPGGTNTFTYNDRGGLLTATGPSGTASFGYDDDGNLVSRTDAAGSATFGYLKGRLDSMTDGITGQRQQLGYDAAGEVKTIDYGGGRVRTFGYDDYGRVNSDVLRNSGGGTVSSVGYGFDLNGHLTRKNTAGTAGAGNNTYTYDDAGRLTSWTGPEGTVGYGWDASGNRIRTGAKTSTFDERNRLLSDGDYTYTYSARGNIATRNSSGLVEPYSFDAFDRLISAEGQNYSYDGMDRLTKRGGNPFTYAGLSDEAVSDGVEYYARGPADELLAVGRASDKQLVISDAHGDVVAAFDPADTALPALTDSSTYDPFGKKVDSAGDTGNVGFQGDWTDPDTGQVDMGARWYQPGTGTFTSRDSVNYAKGDSILANRYTYGAGAPLDYDDPDGHWPSLKSIGSSISSGFSRAVSNVRHYTSSAVSAGWSAFKTFNSFVARGASWVINKTVSAIKTTFTKIGEGVNALRTGNFKNWAVQQARAAQAQLHRAKVAITARAKAAVEQVVKFTKLPVVKALTAPLLTALKVVSVSIKVAASVTAVTMAGIKDPAKFRQGLYLEALREAAPLIEGATKLWDKATQFVEDHAAEIVGFAAGAVVGIGCGAAIGWTGVGAVACGALAGAVGSAVTGYMNGKRGWDLVGTAAMGGLTGALGGALGSVAGQALGAGIRGLGQGLRGAGQGLIRGAREEIASIASGRLSGGALAGGGRSGAGSMMSPDGPAPAPARTTPGGSCSVPGKNSFVPGTAVLMANGSGKPIENVRVGDLVLATDPTTGETGAQPVTNLIVGQGEKKLVGVTIDLDGDRGDRIGKLVATDGHPFWAAELGAWIDATDLRVGSLLRTAAGTYVQITAIERWTAQNQRVHNLTVDTIHTYYVVAGNTPILVHNSEGDDWLYRGLASDHVKLDEARRGIATPWGGHDDPDKHAGGNTRSNFTSWTADPDIALDISREGNGPGVVLRVPRSSVASQIVDGVNYPYEEGEVTIRGQVTGAEVRSSVGGSTFSGC